MFWSGWTAPARGGGGVLPTELICIADGVRAFGSKIISCVGFYQINLENPTQLIIYQMPLAFDPTEV